SPTRRRVTWWRSSRASRPVANFQSAESCQRPHAVAGAILATPLRIRARRAGKGDRSMGKKLTLLLSLLLVVAVTTGPAYALSVPFMSHHETGRISSIDKDAHTFTVTGDKDGKAYTFEMKDRASLANLRTGEHVRVAYKKEGARFVAKSVTERPANTAS